MFQANTLSSFHEVFAANVPELGVVKNQITEFSALLDQIHVGKAHNLVVEAAETNQFAQDHS